MFTPVMRSEIPTSCEPSQSPVQAIGFVAVGDGSLVAVAVTAGVKVGLTVGVAVLVSVDVGA